jgi:hypothetical protein
MGKEWRNLTRKQREPYFDKAEKDKQRFIQELEDYVPPNKKNAKKDDNDEKKIRLTPHAFRNLYLNEFQPPQWPIDHWQVLRKHGCLRSVRVYYNSTDNVKDVKTCVSQRDVVNIGMETIVRQGKLVKSSHSGYTELYKQNKTKLPPNFALYMKTPVSFDSKHLEKHPSPLHYRHVLNVIGYAFDSPKQPDHQYFSRKGWRLFQSCLNKTLLFVFQCASDLGLTTVVLSYVGGGHFQDYFGGGDYLDVFVNAVKHAMTVSQYRGSIELMGAPDDLVNKLKIHNNVRNNRKRIPAIWLSDEAENKLFVNAWDPHSYAGNGNKGDQSLDGFIGRHSAVSYLSCVKLNPHILKNMYPVSYSSK